jgi:glyoxylase-like metal-dependent hydrolase (beta-lactamase superfamily II)
MKKILIILSFFHALLYSQGEKYLKYNETIKQASENLTLRVEKIKDNLYMIEGLGAGMGNIGLFVSDNGLIMIDNSFEIVEDLITSTIRDISPKPFKYILNTHHHYDHSDGNRAYGKMNIPIISHKNVLERQKNASKAYGGIFKVLEGFEAPPHEDKELPTITFSEKITLHEGDEIINLYYFGPGHTDGDSIIKFDKANVIHTGDSFIMYGLPFVDLIGGGSIKGFIKNLDKIISISDQQTIIIPGHGPLSNVEKVRQFRNDLNEYYQKTLEGYNAGLSIKEISNSIKSDLGKTAAFGEANEVKINFINSILLENNITQ